MQQSTTGAAAPQALPFPKVSHRLVVRVNAARDARRHGVSPTAAITAADTVYRATRGDRFQARRAAWAVVDAQCGRTAVHS